MNYYYPVLLFAFQNQHVLCFVSVSYLPFRVLHHPLRLSSDCHVWVDPLAHRLQCNILSCPLILCLEARPAGRGLDRSVNAKKNGNFLFIANLRFKFLKIYMQKKILLHKVFTLCLLLEATPESPGENVKPNWINPKPVYLSPCDVNAAISGMRAGREGQLQVPKLAPPVSSIVYET